MCGRSARIHSNERERAVPAIRMDPSISKPSPDISSNASELEVTQKPRHDKIGVEKLSVVEGGMKNWGD